MSVKKIAIFTHSVNLKDGPFTHISTTLALGFQELGIACDVLVLNVTEEDKARYPNINVINLNTKRASASFLALIRYMREQKPDVILPMPWYFNVVAIWAKLFSGTNTKIIIGEHNICSLEASIEHKKSLRVRYLPTLMRYTYPFGDGIIGVSQDTITDLIDQIKVKTSIPKTVIPNPLDINRVQQRAQQPVDHPWFKDSEVPTIVTVARFAKQKQLDVLLRAFLTVLSVIPARLLILGDGPLRAELEALCRELGIEDYVDMPGYDTNPCKYMAACDVFVLASAWEGCPVALEEALACGAAVIVNDAPGGSKDLVNYGKYGMMVPTKDHDALAQAMIQVLTEINLKKHYQEQALIRAQDFHYLAISKNYLDFCDSVLVSDPKRS